MSLFVNIIKSKEARFRTSLDLLNTYAAVEICVSNKQSKFSLYQIHILIEVTNI